ncbi:unnamed protein product [Ambrosiozyma monospora]|uniref:Unnamed protein product n=1 Tax=Ambrosiozyma monospora TaxID=43982 RepID=A0ACB5T0U4_AMBMO|nr:unnamed protein product [Ambrosiozyma monospora]
MNLSNTYHKTTTISKQVRLLCHNYHVTTDLTMSPLMKINSSKQQNMRLVSLNIPLECFTQRRFLHGFQSSYPSQIGFQVSSTCQFIRRTLLSEKHGVMFEFETLKGYRFIHTHYVRLVAQDPGSGSVMISDKEENPKKKKKVSITKRKKKIKEEKDSEVFRNDGVSVEEDELDQDVVDQGKTKVKGKGKFNLRPYQEQCIQDCLNAIRIDNDECAGDNDKELIDDENENLKRTRTRKFKTRNRRSIAVSLATGGGKTMIFANLIPKLPPNPKTNQTKTLVLVHRKELADQAIRAISRCNPDLNVRLEMGKAKIEPNELDQVDVVVASVPTLARTVERLKKFKPSSFKAVIIDECHHAVSTSFLKLLKYFGCYEPEVTEVEEDENGEVIEDEFEKFKPDNPEDVAYKGDVAVIGFSATLKRHDRIPLRKAFDHIVFEKNMKDLINDGFLSDFTWLKVSAGLRLDEVEVTKGKNGDYKLDSLAEHVNTTKINELVLKTYLHVKQERKLKSSLFFCVNVQHMLDLHQLFKLNGLSSRYVSGSSTKFERELAVNDFLEGKLPILFNCGVFTEGTDFPQVDSVFMVRPTKSQPLLTQMIGRGLRLHDEKEKCVIVDFVDASDIGISLDASLRGKIMGRAGELSGIFDGVGANGESRLRGSNDSELDGEVAYVEFDNETKSLQLDTCSSGYLVFERF